MQRLHRCRPPAEGLAGATTVIGDKGCDSDKIHTLLLEQGITPCIPSRRNCNKKVLYSKKLYKMKMRHKVEDRFAKRKNWRRVTTPLRPLCPYLPLYCLPRRRSHLFSISPAVETSSHRPRAFPRTARFARTSP